MVILGLGSNLENRLVHLRQALLLIKKIPSVTVKQVSPVYISDALLPDNAPKDWDKPYFNFALRCETQLSPEEFLQHIKKIEISIGRKPEKDWGPRVIDIDILAWDGIVQYDEKLHIPHEHLLNRPFALWPLADVAPNWQHPLQQKTAAELIQRWGSRFSGEAPLHTRQIQHRIDTPQLIGIVNITPDSFSDGGKCFDSDAAVPQAKQLILDGAEIIDLGAEATNPGAMGLPAEEEWQRLEPVLKELMKQRSDFFITPLVSVDTRQAFVAEKALALGVDWINDVSGLTNPAMRMVLKDSESKIVMMHHLGIPPSKDSILSRQEDPITVLLQWAENQMKLLVEEGIKQERIIFDIGIGFGKSAEQSLELIRRSEIFKNLGVPILVGHSRKSFLHQFTTKPALERDLETVVLSLQLAQKNIDYLRVHDVGLHARAFKVNSLSGTSL